MAKLSKAECENTPEDRAEDRRAAKRRGVSVAAYEGSAEDERADRLLCRKLNAKRK